jgi:hypothetical protein
LVGPKHVWGDQTLKEYLNYVPPRLGSQISLQTYIVSTCIGTTRIDAATPKVVIHDHPAPLRHC